jgi:hypothetical protein
MVVSKKLRFIIFPYRDYYFLDKYGPTVRDVQFFSVLSQRDDVDRIIVVNRPVSLYERVLGKRFTITESNKTIKFEDTTSFDLIGPLRGRMWTKSCYLKLAGKISKLYPANEDYIDILVDFTPIAEIPYELFPGYIIWYDLIDNFTKHNRFSNTEKRAVYSKYDYVDKNADYITGVTRAALSSFLSDAKYTVPNGYYDDVSRLNWKQPLYVDENMALFGFAGFITDKIDLDAIATLNYRYGARTIIYGKAYDKRVLRNLKSISGVDYRGGFTRSQFSRVMSEFKIGLVPYRESKSHDESPLKLYEYLVHGCPVISTVDYGVLSPYVGLFNDHEHIKNLVDYVSRNAREGVSREVRNSVPMEWSVESRVEDAITNLLARTLYHKI